ncbi:putative ABC transporter permease [Thermoflexales bacterium]|nr:putative ABC transporter permease [Thermoflexales bacterium]
MWRLAFRNLFQNKVRLIISVGGVALALLLSLSLDAILEGIQRQVTTYIDQSGADIFVAQAGVRNMHMASSWLPASMVGKVRGVPGVESVTPILYVTNVIEASDNAPYMALNLAYIIGLPPNATAGGPPRIAEGVSIPAKGEAIIDRAVAAKSGVVLGDKIKILGEELTLAGLSESMTTFTGSIAFISKKDFDRIRGETGAVSFILVKVELGESPAEVARRIENQVDKVTAEPRTGFAAQERKVVQDMSTDIVTIMNLIGFVIGLAVMALTVYTATLARRKEYGVLKALGARSAHLYRAVLAQALISVGVGFALSLLITLILSASVPYLGVSLSLQINGASLIRVGGLSIVIAGLSAMLPIKQIAGLDPALVFRGK